MSTHNVLNVNEANGGPHVFTNGRDAGASTNGIPNGVDGVEQGLDGHLAEPIAIIGMACRLPGGTSSSSKLWDMLAAKRSGQCAIPKSRFNVDGFYHPNPDRPGTMNTAGGYFIEEDIRAFENSFFGINNLEATYMDPQQRKLLEVAYECFENAGTSLEKISGANIGCYVGNFTTDFQLMQGKDSEHLHRYSATGMGTTILSNRLSHAFNLNGPSFVLDTACSSSLYCLHVACTAIESGDCDSAIVAGANLIQSPEQHLGTMKAGVLSKTSTCHTFDASADGYGRADGVGALYVKKLSHAIRDRDPIRSVIRATAVNSNGKTPGITLPSADGQEAVVRKAYKKAGLNFNQTDYVECHGTGTPVGDPIEVEAVSRVFSKGRQDPLLIGSVKTNLGHSEAASGISSLIKCTLALEKGQIPPTIGVTKVNPKIKLDEWNVKIVTETTEWPKHPARRTGSSPVKRASINSFGYGGANAHAILDAAELHVPKGYRDSSEILALARSTFLLPFSATNAGSLKGRVSGLGAIDHGSTSIVDLAYTLSRRSHLPSRGFLLAGQKTLNDDLHVENLRVVPDGKSYSPHPYAFVFTGQGAQWPEMGRELMEEIPSFRRTIQDLDATLQALPEPPSWTLQSTLTDDPSTSQINHASRSQPICTALQVALVRLLADWGIKPEGVIGHSSGEIGAAYAAGFLTAQQAITVAYYRGLVVSGSTMEGAMMAAGTSPDQANELISKLGLGQSIRVACVNSPESVTISGDLAAIDKILEYMNGEGMFARKLKTNGRAYHSHHMSLLGQEYEDKLQAALSTLPTVDRWDSSVKWHSSVSGQLIAAPVDAAYWRENLESPVLFSTAVEKLAQGTQYHLIELGPHSALEMPIKQTRTKLNINENNLYYSSAISRGKNSVTTMLNLIGDLYLHGHDIEWNEVNHVDTSVSQTEGSKEQGQLLVDLPNYPWNYDSLLWNESRSSVEFRERKHLHHDLLGSQASGGDGIITKWRNVLRTKDVPWLEHHKLNETIVFPGAGYIGMAMEAVSQVTETTSQDKPAFVLRHFHILDSLSLSNEPGSDTVEVFTTMRPESISATTKSNIWWNFEISSFASDMAIVHASGLIAIERQSKTMQSELQYPQSTMEQNATRTWYKKFVNVGLNFGDSFQSLAEIHNHGSKEIMHTTAGTKLLQGGGDGLQRQSKYPVHPITLDALFQTGIIASASGIVKNLKAKVPVMIEYARIGSVAPQGSPEQWTIDATSEPVGTGAVKVNAEMHDTKGNAMVQFKNIHAVAFAGGAQEEASEERHPMLRVEWKPDLDTLSSEKFSSYLDAQPSSDKLQALGDALDLLCHKNPRIRVAVLGKEGAEMPAIIPDLLRYQTSFQRCTNFSKGFFTANEEVVLEPVDGSSGPVNYGDGSEKKLDSLFDAVVVLDNATADTVFGSQLERARTFLSAEGSFLSVGTPSTKANLEQAGFSILDSFSGKSNPVMIASPPSTEESKGVPNKEYILVERESDSGVNDRLVSKLSQIIEHPIKRVPFHKVNPNNLTSKSFVISTLELEEPLLSTMSNEEMGLVKTITDNVTNLLWITGGAITQGTRPDFALVSGLSRSLVLEQPSLRFFTLDLDDSKSNVDNTVGNIVSILEKAANDPNPDMEYVQQAGTLHVSRFNPADILNKTWRQGQDSEIVSMALEQAEPCRLSVKNVGQLDSIYFDREASADNTLKADFVEVKVKSVGLNAKDVSVLNGKAETDGATCTLEYSGVITKIGDAVQSLRVNDRVAVMAPGHFSTLECVPESACCKLEDSEDFNVMSTISVVFSTALYALHDRARIQQGESILIHSAAGGLGIAAIQIARLAGAEVYATVGSEEKKQFLISQFGLDESHIFNSHDTSFLSQIMSATNGRGVDVVLNSLSGDLLHESWRACADFGRFVEVGKRDIVAAGKLDMEVFNRNVTFTAFDLSNLYNSENKAHLKTRARLLNETLQLYRSGQIKAIEPLRVFDVSEVSQALRYYSSESRIGKVSVSLEDPESQIKVLPLKYSTTFSPDKSYLLVGCLGGLGRSMSDWMMKRGARKFVFLGRTGTDRAPARRLVDNLTSRGAEVTVVRGDVGTKADVEKMVAQTEGPIGGIIQAAMGLNEALFTAMPREHWMTGIVPKLVGSWNLHNAIKGRDSELDFFMMTSSISGSVGTATESNYCSANYFLDIFARHRRSQGLPATSIGLGMISEVGYLHENPEIEALLLRRGIQAINEDEMLQIVDSCLSNQTTTAAAYDKLAEAHVLTGLEPLGIKELRRKGFTGETPTLNDPRANLLAAALAQGEESSGAGSTSGMHPELAAALESGSSLPEAVLTVVSKKFSNLILIPLDKLDVAKPLAVMGMDSMLAAEFRTWFFQTFKVDIPFLTLLSKTTTIGTLSETTAKEMAEAE